MRRRWCVPRTQTHSTNDQGKKQTNKKTKRDSSQAEAGLGARLLLHAPGAGAVAVAADVARHVVVERALAQRVRRAVAAVLVVWSFGW